MVPPWAASTSRVAAQQWLPPGCHVACKNHRATDNHQAPFEGTRIFLRSPRKALKDCPVCLQGKTGMVTAPGPGIKPPRRSNSRRSLRRAGRTPSMQTIWEWAGSDAAVDAVPATVEALQHDCGGGAPPPRGQLWLRPSGIFPVRLFSRRAFLPRFAVLLPANGVSGGPPRLQLFLVRGAREAPRDSAHTISGTPPQRREVHARPPAFACVPAPRR